MFTNNRMTRAKNTICNSNVLMVRHIEPKFQGQDDSRVYWRKCYCPHTHSTCFEFCCTETFHHPSGLLDVSLSCIWKLYRPKTNLLSARLTSFKFIFENIRWLRTTCVKIFYTQMHTRFANPNHHVSPQFANPIHGNILISYWWRQVTWCVIRPKYCHNSAKILVWKGNGLSYGSVRKKLVPVCGFGSFPQQPWI
jgi:hypothetical protein